MFETVHESFNASITCLPLDVTKRSHGKRAKVEHPLGSYGYPVEKHVTFSYLWVRDQRQLPDVIHIMIVTPFRGSVVEAPRGEPVGVIKNYLLIVEDLQQTGDQPSVKVISDTSTIVTLTGQVTKSLQWGFVIVVDEHL